MNSTREREIVIAHQTRGRGIALALVVVMLMSAVPAVADEAPWVANPDGTHRLLAEPVDGLVELPNGTLWVRDGAVAGEVTLDGRLHTVMGPVGSFTIEPIVELTEEGTLERGAAYLSPAMPLALNASVIRVLIAYTGDARAAAGGTATIELLATSLIASTNGYMANSLAAPRFALAGTMEVPLAEPQSSSDALDAITYQDGVIDQVHAERSRLEADIVVLVAERFTDVGYGGRAWLGGGPRNMFGVVARLGGSLVFAHEVGHLLGSAHDAANAGGWARAPYGYGYRIPSSFRTIMAYQCEYQGLAACQWIGLFSNPNVTYLGQPTGVDGVADNVRSMNESWTTTALIAEAALRFASLELAVSDVEETTATLEWNPAGGALFYRAYFTDVATGETSSAASYLSQVSLIGLTPGTAYKVAVRAESYDGNSSLWGPNGSFTTAGGAPGLAGSFGLVDPTQGQWHLRWADSTERSFFFGNPGDFPIMGDWNCDGIDTPGMYRQSDGYVYLRNSNTQGVGDIRFFFGNPGDIPIAGDFDNDGCDTVSIFRPSESRVFVINALGANDGGLGSADYWYYFGNPGDKPFVGDFDGDGKDTVGLHRESTGLVYFQNKISIDKPGSGQTKGSAPTASQFFFGDPGDRLVAHDWNANGSDTAAIFRPSTAILYARFTNTQGSADASVPFGSGAWLPVAGDFGPSG